MSAKEKRAPDPAEALALLEDMIRVRRFEERSAELYGQEKIRGFLHLYIGEEAIAAGVMHAIGPADAVVATYREHGHALLRGVPANAIMAEMFGKVTGCSRGRGGSMHLFDAKTRFYGGNAIVGGGLPLAVGLAMAEKMLSRGGVVVCFFGEGAVAEGEFHESMNLAALWSLPVLFVCENNLYAMGTALRRSEADTDLVMRARGYGVEAETVDGMDVEAVLGAIRPAVTSMRQGSSPRFFEMRTYRFRAHSMFDPQLYRAKEEVERWKEHDPIANYAAQLTARGVLGAAAVEAMERRAIDETEASVAFAESGELEPESELTRFVYSEVPA